MIDNKTLQEGYNLIGTDCFSIIMDYHKDMRKVVIKKRKKRRGHNRRKNRKNRRRIRYNARKQREIERMIMRVFRY